MSIKEITVDALRTMSDKEGIIFQGCGGDMQEWINGFNKMFTESKILLEGTKFDEASMFTHDGLTCLFFEFKKDIKIDIGKLAIWRIQTHETFGGTWLSDYVPNRLGGFEQVNEQKQLSMKEKPDCPLIGQDGNIFNLVGIASKALKRNGMREAADEMQNRIISSGSYDEVLSIIGEYVNITSNDEYDELIDMEI